MRRRRGGRRRRRPGEHGAVHPAGEPAAWAVPGHRRAQRLRDGAAPPVAEVLAGKRQPPTAAVSRRRRYVRRHAHSDPCRQKHLAPGRHVMLG